jgi:RNase P subunit RPR2
MVKSFKESHVKDLEKLAGDLQREEEKTSTDDLVNTPKYTVMSMVGLTSPVWTLGMFQMVTGESCQYIHAPNRRIRVTLVFDMMCTQCNKCGFVIRYQNTSNLDQHFIRGGLDHNELAGRLVSMK